MSLDEIFSFTSDDPAFTTAMSQSIATYSDSNEYLNLLHMAVTRTLSSHFSQGVLDLLPDNISLQLIITHYFHKLHLQIAFASQSTSGDNIFVTDFSLSFDRNGTI